eukprot:m.15668 g.15668  ORF g.15668 m.15668 type:complete len:421 (+) comp5465_c0_seq1:71-1333(+)
MIRVLCFLMSPDSNSSMSQCTFLGNCTCQDCTGKIGKLQNSFSGLRFTGYNFTRSKKKEGWLAGRSIKNGIFGTKAHWKQQFAVLQGDVLQIKQNTNSNTKQEIKITPLTSFKLAAVPGNSSDGNRLLILQVGNKTYEFLAKTVQDAQSWLSALQNARDNTRQSQSSLISMIQQPEKAALLNNATISKRKFMEIVVKRPRGVPLGLRLAGGSGPGSDPSRPEIVVFWTVKDSLSANADLRKGDLIMHVNRRQFKQIGVEDATDYIEELDGSITFGVERLRTEPATRQPHHDYEPPVTSRLNGSTISGDYGFNSDGDGNEEVFGFDGDQTLSPVPENSPTPASPQQLNPSPEPPKTNSSDNQPNSKPVAESTPEPANNASSPEDDRAAKLARMKAMREMKRQTSMKELFDILKVIDDLPED